MSNPNPKNPYNTLKRAYNALVRQVRSPTTYPAPYFQYGEEQREIVAMVKAAARLHHDTRVEVDAKGNLKYTFVKRLCPDYVL